MPAKTSARSLPAIPQCPGTHINALGYGAVSSNIWMPWINGCLFLGFSTAVMELWESVTISSDPSLGAVSAWKIAAASAEKTEHSVGRLCCSSCLLPWTPTPTRPADLDPSVYRISQLVYRFASLSQKYARTFSGWESQCWSNRLSAYRLHNSVKESRPLHGRLSL